MRKIKIALVGMYGGMWQEFNPGCFLVGFITFLELKKRLPQAEIDVFAIDNKNDFIGLQMVMKHGLKLNFFSRFHQLDILNTVLINYDHLVMGGDIIWGGDDVIEDNPIFFLQSKSFLKLARPNVYFNCIHTFYNDNNIKGQYLKFANAISRADYISVRTPSIMKRLENMGFRSIRYIPDPVLLLTKKDLQSYNFYSISSSKPILGISIRSKISNDFINWLKQTNLDQYNVLVYPFSRQYNNLETVSKIKKEFGNKFNYIEEYLDPLDSFALINNFSLSINDTFHGTIAAIVQDIPFISIDVEVEQTSRKDQLLRSVGINVERNIRLSYFNSNNTEQLKGSISNLLRNPVEVDKHCLLQQRQLLLMHFNNIANRILINSSRI